MKNHAVWISCILAALFCDRTANGAVIMTLEQVGSNVVATGSGTVDLTDLSFAFAGAGAQIYPAFAFLAVGGGGNAPLWDFYAFVGGPASFGSGFPTVASIGTGDELAIYYQLVAVPVGYASGTPLSGTATFDSTTLALLGVTPGIYTWVWGSGAHADSLTLYAGVPAPPSVPEPASALLLALGAAGLVLFRWIRNEKRSRTLRPEGARRLS